MKPSSFWGFEKVQFLSISFVKTIYCFKTYSFYLFIKECIYFCLFYFYYCFWNKNTPNKIKQKEINSLSSDKGLLLFCLQNRRNLILYLQIKECIYFIFKN